METLALHLILALAILFAVGGLLWQRTKPVRRRLTWLILGLALLFGLVLDLSLGISVRLLFIHLGVLVLAFLFTRLLLLSPEI